MNESQKLELYVAYMTYKLMCKHRLNYVIELNDIDFDFKEKGNIDYSLLKQKYVYDTIFYPHIRYFASKAQRTNGNIRVYKQDGSHIADCEPVTFSEFFSDDNRYSLYSHLYWLDRLETIMPKDKALQFEKYNKIA